MQTTNTELVQHQWNNVELYFLKQKKTESLKNGCFLWGQNNTYSIGLHAKIRLPNNGLDH